MDSKQIRQANFVALFRQFRREHMHLPNRGMLKLFAEQTGISDRILSHVKCNRKNIGDKMARQMERGLKLRPGWMDQLHTGSYGMDDSEQSFMETALTIYRASPEEARQMMMEFLKTRLSAPVKVADGRLPKLTKQPMARGAGSRSTELELTK